ncbi:adenylate/guanylate cyclase domain-containing protein [Priestia megaterium]|uniref:adenylate/guanylate cyclase domain-containing protein n=1 Tax=Priestia megaterium TaxID=1404 RepID=UPI0038B11B78
MSLKDLKTSLTEEVEKILSSDFKIIIKETDYVPSIDDSDITYPNLLTGEQKCKLIETCVLYIDIRRSTDLNLSHRRDTMAKLYTAFVRSMARAASYHGGKVRNIIGDRLMVVFDKEDCYRKAVDTAILMNSVSQYILDKQFNKNEIKCGIGIDYGKMLVTKAGIIKQGVDNTSYKSLVWLGSPANIASKLTDVANKKDAKIVKTVTPTVREGHQYPQDKGEWTWFEFTQEEFLKERIKPHYTGVINHVNKYFKSFYASSTTSTKTTTQSTPPILMTSQVFNEFKKLHPDRDCIKQELFKKQSSIDVPSYSGDIYGGDVIFTSFKD